jgi:hypothetical protein
VRIEEGIGTARSVVHFRLWASSDGNHTLIVKPFGNSWNLDDAAHRNPFGCCDCGHFVVNLSAEGDVCGVNVGE